MLTELEIASHPYVIELINKTTESYQFRISELEGQLAWLKKQIFGAKSERRTTGFMPSDGAQIPLLDLPAGEPQAAEATTIKEHQRQKSNKVTAANNAGESGLRFGPEVKVVEIEVPNPITAGLDESEYEVLGERVVERLCQEKTAYYIERLRQPKIKLKETQEIRQDPAPERIIDSPYADISILVGLSLDKFLYHMPLYRQHQRMSAQGIDLSRATLTTWTHSFIDLLSPIYEAQKRSVLSGSVLSIDDSPHKAGRRNKTGKMDQCYFWFLYGDQKEVCIENYTSKGSDVVRKILANQFFGTLLSDGAPAYDSVVAELNLVHAQCWAHARRYFVDAEGQEPLASEKAVSLIRRIYEQEALAPPLREQRLEFRLAQIKPICDEFFDWLELEQQRVALLPKTSYSNAVHYALSRQASLTVFLGNPDVPVDNNHTERAVRPLVLGRKNYLFCWSEIGADKVAVIQSLILTCQLHDIDPWDYLTDVAQRVATHKSADVAQLTPRLWKDLLGTKASVAKD